MQLVSARETFIFWNTRASYISHEHDYNQRRLYPLIHVGLQATPPPGVHWILDEHVHELTCYNFCTADLMLMAETSFPTTQRVVPTRLPSRLKWTDDPVHYTM